jgi:hypothetical protein
MEKARIEVLGITSLIYITSCSFATDKIIRDFNIQSVIIDEATMANEI